MIEVSKYLLLGAGTPFTYQVLQRLLERDYAPLAYIQHGTEARHFTGQFADIPIENPIRAYPLPALLRQYSIPCYYHADLDLVEFIRRLEIDYLLVACWPRLLPQPLLDSVNKAALNLHPSLLPAFRGRDPIRAQMDANTQTLGVSLHLLNEAYDCGDIVLQQAVSVETASYQAIESTCAIHGADLFIRALQSFSDPGWTLVQQQNLGGQ
jgi:methionyl-tRNA formyltransferase